ncbi:hypothetical protein V2S66_30740 [Streptomyces sp. V4-01]|uniref:Asp23/Gls24 family envelope stress response protein n=1 Tax=Actinacidiphila polyblastidii TaxID=3110430 RepID=A0ABU7PKS3_9ACTN|nr:hypothetical protein [Streptomyces sp. V4-01]
MAVDGTTAVSGRPEAAASGQPAASAPAPDAARLVGDERLPCGRLVSGVWDQARGLLAADASHAAGCPYCRQAVAGLAVLDIATHTLRRDEPSARTVADRVIDAVRAETRLGRLVPLDDPGGDLRISETSAAKVLRRAADRVPGVRAASCRLTCLDDGSTHVTLAMTLAATVDEPLPPRAVRVRRAVAYAAWQELGLAVIRIDLTVVSVLEGIRSPAVPEITPGGGGRP